MTTAEAAPAAAVLVQHSRARQAGLRPGQFAFADQGPGSTAILEESGWARDRHPADRCCLHPGPRKELVSVYPDPASVPLGRDPSPRPTRRTSCPG